MKNQPLYSEKRPWGAFHNFIEADHFKLKLIEVAPKKRLSLQSHNHRSEHWIVVQGTAIITNGESVQKYYTGDHVFIPKTQKHRMENPDETIILQIVEIQQGDYFGEDDIIRYEDDFQRN